LALKGTCTVLVIIWYNSDEESSSSDEAGSSSDEEGSGMYTFNLAGTEQNVFQSASTDGRTFAGSESIAKILGDLQKKMYPHIKLEDFAIVHATEDRDLPSADIYKSIADIANMAWDNTFYVRMYGRVKIEDGLNVTDERYDAAMSFNDLYEKLSSLYAVNLPAIQKAGNLIEPLYMSPGVMQYIRDNVTFTIERGKEFTDGTLRVSVQTPVFNVFIARDAPVYMDITPEMTIGFVQARITALVRLNGVFTDQMTIKVECFDEDATDAMLLKDCGSIWHLILHDQSIAFTVMHTYAFAGFVGKSNDVVDLWSSWAELFYVVKLKYPQLVLSDRSETLVRSFDRIAETADYATILRSIGTIPS
jgi:hypothetical protein